jgi:hypothetical protein
MIVCTLSQVPPDHGIVWSVQNTYVTTPADGATVPLPAGLMLEIVRPDGHQMSVKVVGPNWHTYRMIEFRDPDNAWVAY